MATVLVTGASSGIGHAVSARLRSRGWDVIGAARRVDAVPDGVVPVRVDLADEDGVAMAWSAPPLADATIDALILCAGYGDFAPLELTSRDEARRQIEVNVLASMDFVRRVLPGMRAAGRGRIVFVSSVASRFSSPMGGWYHAGKAAVESLADGLRQEVGPFGIDVVVVQPGVVATPWHATALGDLERRTAGTPYERMGAGTAAYHRESASSGMVMSVEAAADVVVEAATVDRPRTRYLAGRGARAATLLPRLLPDRVFDGLTARQFGTSAHVTTRSPRDVRTE